MDKKKGKIYIPFHKEHWRYESEIFTPIQVGKKESSPDLNMISDDTGDNISYRNPNFCELTAMYWVWKNTQHDFVGFYHYRRYFNLNEAEQVGGNNTPQITVNNVEPEIINKYKLCDDNEIRKLVNEYDIILPRPFYLGKSITEHYYSSHISEDWHILQGILREKLPDYTEVISQVFSNNLMYTCNMFIMNYDIFCVYMEWLFEILFEAEKKVLVSAYPYQSRVFGFMGERLFNLFLVIVSHMYQVRFKELDMVLLDLPDGYKPSAASNSETSVKNLRI